MLNNFEKDEEFLGKLDSELYSSNFEVTNSQSDLLKEYYDLLRKQSSERDILIERIEQLIATNKNQDQINERVNEIFKLLLELKNQYSTTTHTNPPLVSMQKDVPEVVIPTPSIMDDSELSGELTLLNDLLKEKKEEVNEKDMTISSLNLELESITTEKENLVEELEKMNQVIESWKTQIELLEKLAATDPRYRVIGALKKHDSLTEIQLAFTLGTSIMQIRKFVMDLKDLGLVSIDRQGKLHWIGKETADGLF